MPVLNKKTTTSFTNISSRKSITNHHHQQTPTNNNKLTPITKHNEKSHQKSPVTTLEKSQTTPSEGKNNWEMAPTPPLSDQELMVVKSPSISFPSSSIHNVGGLSSLLSDSPVPTTRYRNIQDQMQESTIKNYLFKSPPKTRLMSPPTTCFQDSKILLAKLEDESTPSSFDPLSKIEKLRRRLSLLKSQIKQSTQLLSEGNNLLISPNKNRSVEIQKQSTTTSALNDHHFNRIHNNDGDDSFLLLGTESTPSKTTFSSNNNNNNTLPSTPSRKMSALTLLSKSPSSVTSTPSSRLFTPPPTITATTTILKSPSSILRKRKLNDDSTISSSPPKHATMKSSSSSPAKNNSSTTPKALKHHNSFTSTLTPRQSPATKNSNTTPKTLKKPSTPQSSKRNLNQSTGIPVNETTFNYDGIFTPKKTTDHRHHHLPQTTEVAADESFSLDLFKTPTPVKPKNPMSIKINGQLVRRSLSLAEEETVSRNIFEEEDDDFVFKERKKKIHKSSK